MQAYYIDHSSMQVHYIYICMDPVTLQAYYVHHVSKQVHILYSVLGYHASMQVYYVCIMQVY